MNSKKLVRVPEYYRSPISLTEDERFSIEELGILEKDFFKYLQVIPKYTGEQIIQTQEYVGYIILPNHIISIVPKIPQISFINMLRYAIGLTKIIPDYFELSEEKNYYDIIVLFFLEELEKLLFRGLNTGYKIYDDNLSCIRGKILFKEHLTHNFNRNDKIFCSYSELTTDILENRIIKYTIYELSQVPFLDDTIDSKLLNFYNRLDQINLVSISLDSFKIIEFTPLNEHYRTILALSELLLRDASLDEETLGKKTAISFLVDMNALFEKFVVRLFEERIKTEKLNVEEQKVRYADITSNELQLKLDILISYKKKPILILDTKYKKFEGSPEISHVAQLTLYSNSTGVENCCLIYAGKLKEETHTYFLHHGIKLNILSFDLQASNKYEFESKCDTFINSVNSLLEPMIENEES
jgi:5-methylcytosine-specific restriction enzyme subunit McrC